MNSYFKKKVSLEEQKAQMEDQFLSERQMAFMIYEYFRVTGAHEAVLDYSDLFRITSQGDGIQDFDTRWDQVLLSTSEVPNDILEILYKMRKRESDQLQTVLAMYEQEPNQDRSKPSYQKLEEETCRSKDQNTEFSRQKRKN